MPKSRKTNENEILSECKSAREWAGERERAGVREHEREWQIVVGASSTRTHVRAMQKL